MTSRYVNIAFQILVLVLLQALVLDHVRLFGFITPYLYLYLIIKMETTSGRIALLWVGFLAGLLVDILLDTSGLNAAATTAVAFARPWLLSLFSLEGKVERGFKPSIRSMGAGRFFRYTLFSTGLHLLLYFLLTFLSLQDVGMLALKILLCSLLSAILILLLDLILPSR